MSVSGLVVTLQDTPAADAAFHVLLSHPRLTVGERFGHRVALIAETDSAHSDLQLVDELNAIPGIERIDVVCVHFDETSSQDGHARTQAP
ncbi:MAG: hypothetical protein AB7K52_05275 [Phycisphaerales bacterium]